MPSSVLPDSQLAALIKSLGPFEDKPTLAIAVSGGADSMALCLLAQRWAILQNGKIIALTVDHRLRPESADEAIQVGKWLKAKGIEHHILTLNTLLATSGIQHAARDARYALLYKWCRAQNILHLLTAHHQNDQAETYTMRNARNSGIDGLACMSALTERNGIRLLRPLLTIPKNQLVEFLREQQQPWAEDPTNAKDTYTRNRIRKELNDSTELAKAAIESGITRQRLETETAKLLARHVTVDEKGFAILNNNVLELPRDSSLRILSAIATTIGGRTYPPRSDHLERHYESLQNNTRRNFNGCMWTPQKNDWLVSRETASLSEDISIEPGESLQWDRFHVILKNATNTHYTLGKLGADGLQQLRKNAPNFRLPGLPKQILHTLPALKSLEAILCVPHIGYEATAGGPRFQAHFHPVKPLAGQAFTCNNQPL